MLLKNKSSKLFAFILFFSIQFCRAQTIDPVKKNTAQETSVHVLNEQEQLFEQKDYVIGGIVVDEKQKPVKGAAVTVLNNDNKIISYTDDASHYELKLKYPEVKDYTFLSFSYTGKQTEIRNIHRSAFPISLNMEMEVMKHCGKCDSVIVQQCCGGIDISFTTDKLFEPDPVPVSKKTKKTFLKKP
ncbi:MAG: carboxypeptidase-like regulatory domain-containing protein [Ferruginibacter sp.]